MIAFRQCDRRYPFLWEGAGQPAGRWHGPEDGPVQYLADTPVGAWAEFLRHEEITEPEDLHGISRAIWAVRVDDGTEFAASSLPLEVQRGGLDSYERCRQEAAAIRHTGAAAMRAPSAALRSGTAGGWCTDHGLRPGPAADGEVLVLFGRCPEAVGWPVVAAGCPPDGALPLVRHF